MVGKLESVVGKGLLLIAGGVAMAYLAPETVDIINEGFGKHAEGIKSVIGPVGFWCAKTLSDGVLLGAELYGTIKGYEALKDNYLTL